MRPIITLVVAVALAAGACPDPGPEETDPDGTLPADAPPLELSDEVVAEGLEIPWALDFIDEETIILTERPGRVRVVEEGSIVPEPVAQLSVAHTGEAGLLGLALHPEFPDTGLVYLYYTYEEAGELENRISRFPLTEGARADWQLGEEEVLLEGIPGARFHDGGRLAFGPDGMLYATTGDAGEPASGADPDDVAGSVLRISANGSVPDDNPFAGSAVWAYGVRNPQGLAWDAEGRLWESEHGPSGEFGLCCNDELNLIERGAFHGWPLRSGQATGMDPGDPELPPDLSEGVPPVADSGDDTWAPAGLAYLPDPEPGNLLMASLAGAHLRRFVPDPDDPRELLGEERALEGYGRLREAVTGPDGCVWVLTSNRDGRGDPHSEDDRLIRACPGDG